MPTPQFQFICGHQSGPLTPRIVPPPGAYVLTNNPLFTDMTRKETLMTLWKNCTTDIYYQDEGAEMNDPGYQVRIDGDELVLSYETTKGWVNYKGKDLGGGHFELYSEEVDGRSMLHRAPEAEILEGFWSEDGSRGMWRIHLID